MQTFTILCFRSKREPMDPTYFHIRYIHYKAHGELQFDQHESLL
jgi:hypothetical protein